jgi:hypothetical protein
LRQNEIDEIGYHQFINCLKKDYILTDESLKQPSSRKYISDMTSAHHQQQQQKLFRYHYQRYTVPCPCQSTVYTSYISREDNENLPVDRLAISFAATLLIRTVQQMLQEVNTHQLA